MALIDQQKVIKKIRSNRERVADTEYIKGLNAGIEYSIEVVEQMKGQKIIHCKDCVYHGWDIVDCPHGMTEMIHWCDKFYTGENESLEVEPTDFCKWGERKSEK